MTNISRNAPCPCGSGKKYKKCCQISDDMAPAAMSESTPWFSDVDELSNSVITLVEENKLDEAEAVCMRLLSEYPDCVDGYMRLIKVHEARGNYALAADYAEKAVAHMKADADGYEADAIEEFEKEAARLRAY